MYIYLYSANLFTSTVATQKTPQKDLLIFLEKFHFNYRKICKHNGTRLIIMSIYTILEISDVLCQILGIDTCPEGLASMVHQFSGGNPFWCRKMALFIHSTGSEEFMTAMNPGRSDNPIPLKEFQPNRILENSSFYHDPTSTQSQQGLILDRDSCLDSYGRSQRSLIVDHRKSSFHVPSSPKSSATLSTGTVRAAAPLRTGGGVEAAASQGLLEGEAAASYDKCDYEDQRSTTTANLELFIVCRLGKNVAMHVYVYVFINYCIVYVYCLYTSILSVCLFLHFVYTYTHTYS